MQRQFGFFTSRAHCFYGALSQHTANIRYLNTLVVERNVDIREESHEKNDK